MNSAIKTAIMSLAVAATTLAALPAANAGERYYRHHGPQGPMYRGSNDLAVAGILGLAAGALVVGLSAQSQPEPVYGNPYRKPRPRPIRDYGETAYYGGVEPWTRDWYEYCSDRYRSFDPRSGTYLGYDGQERFCVAN